MLNKILSQYFKIHGYAKGNYNRYCIHKGMHIGPDSTVYTTKIGTEPWLISIGKNVTITEDVIFVTHDGSLRLVKDENGKRRYYYDKIEIGNNVFVGVRSILLPGIVIGDDVIVAAGSVVTKNVSSNSVVAGVPARKISNFDDFQEKHSDKKNYKYIEEL